MNRPGSDKDLMSLQRQVAYELEHVRTLTQMTDHSQSSTSSSSSSSLEGTHFPSACLSIVLHQIPGNDTCVDCGCYRPEWASVTFGALLCLQCSGRHRSYGVQTSYVKSIFLDKWTHSQILAMLEGGNEQLLSFFDRHQMGNERAVLVKRRYHTKAAHFYRHHLAAHIDQIQIRGGVYQGREASRAAPRTNNRTSTSSNDGNNKKSQLQRKQQRRQQQRNEEGSRSSPEQDAVHNENCCGGGRGDDDDFLEQHPEDAASTSSSSSTGTMASLDSTSVSSCDTSGSGSGGITSSTKNTTAAASEERRQELQQQKQQQQQPHQRRQILVQ